MDYTLSTTKHNLMLSRLKKTIQERTYSFQQCINFYLRKKEKIKTQMCDLSRGNSNDPKITNRGKQTSHKEYPRFHTWIGFSSSLLRGETGRTPSSPSPQQESPPPTLTFFSSSSAAAPNLFSIKSQKKSVSTAS